MRAALIAVRDAPAELTDPAVLKFLDALLALLTGGERKH